MPAWPHAAVTVQTYPGARTNQPYGTCSHLVRPPHGPATGNVLVLLRWETTTSRSHGRELVPGPWQWSEQMGTGTAPSRSRGPQSPPEQKCDAWHPRRLSRRREGCLHHSLSSAGTSSPNTSSTLTGVTRTESPPCGPLADPSLAVSTSTHAKRSATNACSEPLHGRSMLPWWPHPAPRSPPHPRVDGDHAREDQ